MEKENQKTEESGFSQSERAIKTDLDNLDRYASIAPLNRAQHVEIQSLGKNINKIVSELVTEGIRLENELQKLKNEKAKV